MRKTLALVPRHRRLTTTRRDAEKHMTLEENFVDLWLSSTATDTPLATAFGVQLLAMSAASAANIEPVQTGGTRQASGRPRRTARPQCWVG
jgi:hypothetical protein